MTNQVNVDKVRQDVIMTWEDAAKIRTVIKGKTMPPCTFNGRKTRKESRPMSISYYIYHVVSEHIKDVKPDAESIAWAMEGRRKTIAKRQKQDELIRKGANRKPKSQWKKPGRVAGKVYPKYDEAMKRVHAKRRAEKNLNKTKHKDK